MMLKVIEDEKLIARYARQFAGSFKPFMDEKIKVKLGHQGASYGAKVLWSKRLGIWIFSQATKDVRYWNAFGLGKPQASGHLPITAEINFPRAGIDRKTGAAFARDACDRLYVIHRGKIGGGKKGIGKSLFEENYRGNWAWMEDGDLLTEVAVIGALQSPRFALQAAQFVRKIEKLKSAASFSSQTSLNFSEVFFHEELVGSPPSSPLDNISDACDHDLVVSQLAALLHRWKFKIGNDANTELFLMQPDSDSVSHIITVCVDGREKTVLAAAAKLLLQKSAQSGHPSVNLMMPEGKMDMYVQQMQRIQIEVLGYRVEGEKIIFPDLGRIRHDQNLQQ
ncbi:MAG: hypothetical protein ACYDGO_00140 [Smithellaceae bacterium]